MNAAINNLSPESISGGSVIQNRVAGSKSVSCNFGSSCQATFQRGSASLCSCQPGVRVPVPLHTQ